VQGKGVSGECLPSLSLRLANRHANPPR
jgi:hypothetical protein